MTNGTHSGDQAGQEPELRWRDLTVVGSELYFTATVPARQEPETPAVQEQRHGRRHRPGRDAGGLRQIGQLPRHAW